MSRRKNCFVIMPFSETSTDHDDTYWSNFFNDYLREAVQDCGYHCYRSETSACNITSKIIQNLLEDELVVAVLTDNNPNVWYELAARHAFHKNTIMLIQKDQKIPFDVMPYGAILYEDSLRGYKNLMTELKNFIKYKLIDNTDHSDDIDYDLKDFSEADNPISSSLLSQKYIKSLPQTYRITTEGLSSISFPHDLKLSKSPCQMLVIGLRQTFLPAGLLKIIQDKRHQINILVNRDKNVALMRATALGRLNKENYYIRNERDLEDFRLKFGNCKNITIREYTRYPFGLYINVGNYSWFTPLWNSDDKGSAIHQLVIEVKRKSHIGWKLYENFIELWNNATPVSD